MTNIILLLVLRNVITLESRAVQRLYYTLPLTMFPAQTDRNMQYACYDTVIVKQCSVHFLPSWPIVIK